MNFIWNTQVLFKDMHFKILSAKVAAIVPLRIVLKDTEYL